MDVSLTVMKGAKSGGKIPIKKEQFLVGRSRKCNLCAGTDSISRQHCVITRADTRVFIEDLGSRNGTFVNGNRIDKPLQLKSGDEIAVGPLRFLVAISNGISNLKRSKVKSVADAAHRTARAHSADVLEDDITSWLSSPSPPASITDTQTIRFDDTSTEEIKKAANEIARQDVQNVRTTGQGHADPEQSELDKSKTKAGDSKSKRSKRPGKLPHIPTKPGSKDSREAATEALRSWNRRH